MSRFLPRFLGVWLAIDGVAWMILSRTGVLSPRYYDKLFTYAQPASFGESGGRSGASAKKRSVNRCVFTIAFAHLGPVRDKAIHQQL